MKKITIIIAIYIIGICLLFSAQPQLDMTLTLFQNRQDMSIIYGVTALGVPYPILVDSSGNIRTISQPYTYAIAEENIADHEPVRRFGLNSSVGTSLETIDSTSDLFTYLTAGETLEISSTSTSDTLLGTGVKKVIIYGLTDDYVLTDEVINLSGTTAVYTTVEFFRVLSFYDYDVGSSAYNVGIISLKNNAGTDTIHIIPAGEGRSNFAHFTVPVGYTLYVTNWYGSENSTKGTSVSFWSREYGDGGWRLLRLYTLLDDTFENNLLTPLSFPEKTDIELRGKAVLSGANVAAGFYGWMEKN